MAGEIGCATLLSFGSSVAGAESGGQSQSARGRAGAHVQRGALAVAGSGGLRPHPSERVRM